MLALTRRQFFSICGVATVAGTIPATVGAIPPKDKQVIAWELHDALVEIYRIGHTKERTAAWSEGDRVIEAKYGPEGSRSPETQASMNAELDELQRTLFPEFTQAAERFFCHLMRNFSHDTRRDDVVRDVRIIFNYPHSEEGKAIYDQHWPLDEVFVLMMARNALALHRLPVRPSLLSAWDAFSDKYQDLVLSV